MRGKRRLHKRPNNYEVERCKIWLDDEMRLVKPTTVAAFGVTAACADRTPAHHRQSVRPTAAIGERKAAYQSFAANLKVAAADARGRAKARV